MRRVIRYEVYTGIRYKTQRVLSVFIYSIYSVINTERATWSWFGANYCMGIFNKNMSRVGPGIPG